MAALKTDWPQFLVKEVELYVLIAVHTTSGRSISSALATRQFYISFTFFNWSLYMLILHSLLAEVLFLVFFSRESEHQEKSLC